MAGSVRIKLSMKDPGGKLAQLDGATKQEYLNRLINLFHELRTGSESGALDVGVDQETEVAATCAFTVAQASATTGDKIAFVIPGGPTVVLTAGTESTSEGTYSILTDNTTVAASIASCINNYPAARRHFSATSSSGTVTVTCLELGSAGNAYKIAKNVTTAAAVVIDGNSANKSGSFSGGKDASDRASMTVTLTQASLVAGQTLRIGPVTLAWAVSAANENQVTIGGSDTAAATNLAAAINAHSVLKQYLVASSSAGVVTITHWCGGRDGEMYRVFTEGTAASGTVIFGGLPVADETVTINGVVLTFKASAATEAQVTIGADATATGANLAATINAHSTLSKYLSAANVTGTVTITCLVKGVIGNTLTLAESATNTTVGAAALAGGLEPAGMSLSAAAPATTTSGVYRSDARNFTFGMGTAG